MIVVVGEERGVVGNTKTDAPDAPLLIHGAASLSKYAVFVALIIVVRSPRRL